MTLPIALTPSLNILATGPGLTNDMLGDYHGTPPVHILFEQGLRTFTDKLTVEPGCYFMEPLLERALADPASAAMLDAEALAPLRGTGGVRLEDVVVVTASGARNLTRAPRTLHEVEAVTAGGRSPPAWSSPPQAARARLRNRAIGKATGAVRMGTSVFLLKADGKTAWEYTYIQKRMYSE